MKAARSHQHHKGSKAGAHRSRPMNDDQLNQQLQTMMLDDEWNSPWDESLDFDDRDYRTVDED